MAQEVQRVEKQLNKLDTDFHKNLELLKKGILNEGEFNKANQAKRDERATLEFRRASLAQELEAVQRQDKATKALPKNITSFLKDFFEMDVRRQKAHLQTILKAVHIYKDGKIELELRA